MSPAPSSWSATRSSPIYSFQGADPALRHHARALRGRRSPSSAPSASAATCFILPFRRADPAARRRGLGLIAPGSRGRWSITRSILAPGRVELWPFCPVFPRRPWNRTGTRRSTRSPRRPGTGASPPGSPGGSAPRSTRGWSCPEAIGRSGPATLIPVQRRNEIFNAGDPGAQGAGVPVGADLLRLGASSRSGSARRAPGRRDPDRRSVARGLPAQPARRRHRGRGRRARPSRPGSRSPRSIPEAPERWAAPARALLGDLRAQADYLRPFELIERDADPPWRPGSGRAPGSEPRTGSTRCSTGARLFASRRRASPVRPDRPRRDGGEAPARRRGRPVR